VACGDFTMLLAEHEQVYAFTRRYEGTELLVLANLSGAAASVELPPGWEGAELLLANVAEPGDGGALGPWEARIHRRRAAD
jgi:oligo-1,6-glucosidase